MTNAYMPPDTTDLGTITHAGQELRLRLHPATGGVYLFTPDPGNRPVEKRPPAVIADCRHRHSPRITIYSAELHERFLSVPDWKVRLCDKIALAVRPYTGADTRTRLGDRGWNSDGDTDP
ncbi:hypothetical protein [Salininema proteolyticum]|uniref:Uncharacterized protein n=1 Tax=Salininema proteolyticum TaxID=1607685 RepID=A0ABV8TWX3_9ACTN